MPSVPVATQTWAVPGTAPVIKVTLLGAANVRAGYHMKDFDRIGFREMIPSGAFQKNVYSGRNVVAVFSPRFTLPPSPAGSITFDLDAVRSGARPAFGRFLPLRQGR